MALDFPSSPVNGQVYDNFIYDAAKGTWKSLSAGASPSILVNPTINNATINDSMIEATADSPSNIPLIVNGAPSQTANLQEWKNSAGSILSKIDLLGNFSISNTSSNAHIAVSNTSNSSSAFNYILSGANDTGVKAVHFLNSSTRTDDGGVNGYTIRNDGGPLHLGNSAQITNIYGLVTMPNQPLFSATDTRALNITNAVLTSANCYNQIDYNVGNYFNASTGRFTAPVAGYYDMFAFISDASGDSKNVNLRLTKNDQSNVGPLSEAYNQTGDGSVNVTARAFVYCNVGDYLGFQAARLLTIDGVQHKRFLIRLVQ